MGQCRTEQCHGKKDEKRSALLTDGERTAITVAAAIESVSQSL